MASPHWVKLEVARTPAGQLSWLACLRSTAEFYGWLDSFPEYRPPVWTTPEGSRAIRSDLTDKRYLYGGTSIRICRSPSRSGTPAGLTNRFRVSSCWRLKDSATLAAATTAEWQWMETRDGVRRTRQQWVAMQP